MVSLEDAQEFLQTEIPESSDMHFFMGVPLKEFSKEDLLKMIGHRQKEYDQLRESADQNRRMHQMFAELRKKAI